MKKTFIIITSAVSLLLSGCGESDPCTTASNPSECRAWGDAGGDINDYLIGGMVGYMLANRGGQTVIIRDSNYHGNYRPLRRALMNESAQIRHLKAKVERQRTELRRQQRANAVKKAEIRSMKSEKRSAWKSSNSSWSSRSSSRSSSSSSSFKSGKK